METIAEKESNMPRPVTAASFVALFVAVLVLTLGHGLLGTFLSLRLTLDGVSTQTTGLVMAAYYLGLILGALLCPRLVQQVGHIRSFAAFAAINCVAAILHAIQLDPLWWGGLRFVTGVTMMGLFMVAESWVNECASTGIRGRVFSLYMIVAYVGQGGGQFLLNCGDVQSQNLLLIAAIFFALCLVPISVTQAVHPPFPEVNRFMLGKLFSRVPLGAFGCLTAGLINSTFYSLGPVFGHQTGFSISGVAWFMGLTILGGLLSQWPVGNLSDRFDRRTVLASISLALALMGVIMAWGAGKSLVLLLVLTPIWGGLAFTIYPLSVAHTHDKFLASEIVSVSASLILSFGIGAILGPILAAALMTAVGPAGMYLFVAACSSLFGISSLIYLRKLPSETAGQALFVSVPRTSPVIAALAPLSEPEECSGNNNNPVGITPGREVSM